MQSSEPPGKARILLCDWPALMSKFDGSVTGGRSQEPIRTEKTSQYYFAMYWKILVLYQNNKPGPDMPGSPRPCLNPSPHILPHTINLQALATQHTSGEGGNRGVSKTENSYSTH